SARKMQPRSASARSAERTSTLLPEREPSWARSTSDCIGEGGIDSNVLSRKRLLRVQDGSRSVRFGRSCALATASKCAHRRRPADGPDLIGQLANSDYIGLWWSSC